MYTNSSHLAILTCEVDQIASPKRNHKAMKSTSRLMLVNADLCNTYCIEMYKVYQLGDMFLLQS